MKITERELKHRADENTETEMSRKGQSKMREGIHGVYSTARHDCLSCLVLVTTALILFFLQSLLSLYSLVDKGCSRCWH